MGSVSSTNPGVANLLQTLANVNSPVLSSPAAVTALQNASPADVVQLSDAATELQTVDEMFGASTGSTGSGSSTANVFANLDSSLLASAPGASTTGTPSAANFQTEFQSAENQALFGGGASGNSPTSLIDLLG